MLDNSKILDITEKLIVIYNPTTIYLFGSYAWGSPEEHSDLDILIIVENSDEKMYKRMKPAYQALRGLKIPKDILVYTVQEFKRYENDPSSLMFKIKNDGMKL